MEKGSMGIERDPNIKFHEQGTLHAVTRWISTHDEGIAEWLKNARRAYQPDRASVEEKHRCAVLLLKDGDQRGAARIGLLDVGGATLEDVTAWSTWQDPNASHRASGIPEEETQGNGGKAYMYRLFEGPARILGVRDRKRNCKGFEGPAETVERGTPGFMPSALEGREVPIASFEAELGEVLERYGILAAQLQPEVQRAVREREAFTIVEGIEPRGLYKGRIDADDLVQKVTRHDQSTLAVQQLRLYAVHNGRAFNGGKPIELEPIAPYPGLEQPRIYEVPVALPLGDGELVSTTEVGRCPKGRLVLFTSRENMYSAYKKLKPRWKVAYRTRHQMIGSKPVAELAPATPGSYFVFGTIELDALEPGYVEHGRRRPKPGPLVEALDLFIAEKIRELAKAISDLRRHEQDQRSLDEVHQENKRLDEFKNRFLPSDGGGGGGGNGDSGDGPTPPPPPPPREYGKIPEAVELRFTGDVLRVGCGARLRLNQVLHAQVKDRTGKIVPNAQLEWFSSDPHIVEFKSGDILEASKKGESEIWVRVKGTHIESARVRVQVWVVDHVLLIPRILQIPLGKRKQILAEVTNDDGFRATDVYLEWRHDADDQLIVRIASTGWVTGNRPGRTSIKAGAGDIGTGGVWARIPVEVTVVPNPEQPQRGGGFAELKVTGRDIDPATSEVRPGDPDAPALWQETSDFLHNVWWLNLESPEAAFAFAQRGDQPRLWRNFHVQKVIDMVIQVHMQEEFTKRGDSELRDFWASHKAALDRHEVSLTQAMWDKLQRYVEEGGELE
jgi:hypothetical protein